MIGVVIFPQPQAPADAAEENIVLTAERGGGTGPKAQALAAVGMPLSQCRLAMVRDRGVGAQWKAYLVPREYAERARDILEASGDELGALQVDRALKEAEGKRR